MILKEDLSREIVRRIHRIFVSDDERSNPRRILIWVDIQKSMYFLIPRRSLATYGKNCVSLPRATALCAARSSKVPYFSHLGRLLTVVRQAALGRKTSFGKDIGTSRRPTRTG